MVFSNFLEEKWVNAQFSSRRIIYLEISHCSHWKIDGIIGGFSLADRDWWIVAEVDGWWGENMSRWHFLMVFRHEENKLRFDGVIDETGTWHVFLMVVDRWLSMLDLSSNVVNFLVRSHLAAFAVSNSEITRCIDRQLQHLNLIYAFDCQNCFCLHSCILISASKRMLFV